MDLLFLVDLGTLINWRSRFEKPVSFRDQASRHARKLGGMGVREKFKYVETRAKDRIRRILSIGKKITETVVRNVYFASGRPLPPLLRRRYLTSVDEWAMQHYEPQVYADDLILFKAKGSFYDPGIVATLTAGKLHLHELPCRHDEIIRDPHVSIWASQLKAYLHKAQATQRGANLSISPKENNEELVSEQVMATRQA